MLNQNLNFVKRMMINTTFQQLKVIFFISLVVKHTILVVIKVKPIGLKAK